MYVYKYISNIFNYIKYIYIYMYIYVYICIDIKTHIYSIYIYWK